MRGEPSARRAFPILAFTCSHSTKLVEILSLLDGEELTPVLKSPDGEHSQAKPLPVFDSSDLLGWTFLMKHKGDSSDLLGRTFLVKHKGDGEPAAAKIIKEITDRDSRLADQPECKRFLASVYDNEFQEVVTHNERSWITSPSRRKPRSPRTCGGSNTLWDTRASSSQQTRTTMGCRTMSKWNGQIGRLPMSLSPL